MTASTPSLDRPLPEEPATGTRVVVVTGKGGVGKTTTAAAMAVTAARRGVRTLVLSADPAHSLADALGRSVPASEPVEVEPGLHALHVGRGRLKAEWRPVQAYLRDVLAILGVDSVTGAELTRVPGEAEVAALIELGEQVSSGGWGLVVLDCAPTSEAVRLLAMPEAFGRTLRRLLPRSSGPFRGLRPLAGAAAGLPLPGDDVLDAVATWQEQMTVAHEILTDPTSSVRIVVTPEHVVVAEARRLWTALCLHGYAVDGVVVNRVLPDVPGDIRAASPFLESWSQRQQQALEEIDASFEGTHLVRTPLTAVEPIGPDALAILTASWVDSWVEPVEVVPRAPIAIDATSNGYVLSAHLPHVSAQDVSVQRLDGDLLLGVGDHRRVVTLPTVLQGCRVIEATVADGRLAVSFEHEEVRPRA